MYVLVQPSMTLDLATASRFALLALGHVEREYPHKLDHVLTGPADAKGPRALHPIFYGSFDWHSCVHGYWLLARLRRALPELPERAAIDELFARKLTPENVASELAYLRRPSSRGFERPYGWAWLLMLAAELRTQGSTVLAPLADAFAARFSDWLPRATYPIRAGTHANTAFAVTLALAYADPPLATLLRDTAGSWFAGDRDCQGWEPSGDDFLSPALMEAECMRRVLPSGDFEPWLAAFLPRLAARDPRTLFVPATVSDRTDGKIAHLDGLNLSRAWCFRGLAGAVEPAFRATLLAAADEHLRASLPHVAGDYMGEHWLATFALLALT
jgi:hypothetical protein